MSESLELREKSVDTVTPLSKKALKKEEKKARKEKALNDQKSVCCTTCVVDSVESSHYGFLKSLRPTCPPRQWCHIKDIDASQENKCLWVRCRVYESRCKGSLGFLTLREGVHTIQGVLDAKRFECGKDIIKWTASVPLESVLDIYGEVVVPAIEIQSTSQKVEICISKIFCISRAATGDQHSQGETTSSCCSGCTLELPFMLRDASRPDNGELETDAITVKLETRLDNRILDLRTKTNTHIFHLQSQVTRLFREFLYQHNFCEIHTPKCIGGAAEGGSSVFHFSYFGERACLAQSPQLHKQMAICADMNRVFEIGPVFRAENSNTHRHLCEFTGMDLEMVIENSFVEVVDMVDGVLKHIFSGLWNQNKQAIDDIHDQYPSEPFTWLENTPKLLFTEGIQLLRDAGHMIPQDISTFDLSTPLEKALGQIVKQKYKTDFYFLLKYPLGVRPFYTMPSLDDPEFSNSFDAFMRGEEIISGAQRIHDSDVLIARAKQASIPLDSIQSYLDAFKLGVFPHGGCGIGLERVVMLFLGLDNIRKTSMFPRDPRRIMP